MGERREGELGPGIRTNKTGTEPRERGKVERIRQPRQARKGGSGNVTVVVAKIT